MKNPYLILLLSCLLLSCKVQSTSTTIKKYEISAITDYQSYSVKGFVSPYIDKERKAFAIDASKFKNKYAAVTFLFEGNSGKYDVHLHTLAELDGESNYRIAINNQLLKGTRTNPIIFDTGKADYAPTTHLWRKVNLQNNDIIRVEFSSETNGKIPEGDITAFSRGRFTGISLIPIN